MGFQPVRKIYAQSIENVSLSKEEDKIKANKSTDLAKKLLQILKESIIFLSPKLNWI